jgi:membrane carboxypeptidase/penicillin-binding protein PbpC
MVMNPKTGEILSMVGSADYNSASISGKFNVAVDGLRQPGSSIKPVTYLAMLRKGFTPASMLVDAPTKFQQLDSQDPYEPKNYDGKFRGPVSLRNSLGNSLNINSVKALAIVGIENFLQITDQMGFPTLQPTQENLKRFGLALTLGGGEVHLIDTVSAYSAFANGGTRVEPNAILKVTDAKGNNLYEFRPVEGPRVMTPEEAFLIDNILSDNTARTMAFGANSLLNTNKPIAVKTGTTNDRKDNWAIGWSQDFMVGVWVGNSDNTAMKAVASGVSGASPIWRKIVNDLLARGYKAPDWVVPPGVEQVEVDDISGHPKHDDFPSHPEWVIKGTVPANPDPIHEKLKLCKGENKLATDARVASGDYEEKEFVVLKEDDPYSKDGKNRWQEGIDGWVNASTDGKYKVPTEYCGENSDIFVRINQPEDQHKYDSEDIEIDVTADSGDGIEKIEIWVDGSLKETVNSNHYHNTLKLPAGRHEVYGKAKSRGGKEASTGTMHIGTGGQDWKAPDPSPTPSPSPSPSPSPTPAGITGCNTACTTDAQCTTLNPLLSCSVAQGNKCRLTSNPALATCQ